MKKTIEILRDDLLPGDVTITSNRGNRWIKVEREVKDPTPREQVEEILLEVKRRGGGNFVADMDDYVNRVMSVLAKSPKPVEQPDRPAITRAHFFATLEATVADNHLDKGEDFNTIMVFAADRLGLY